MALAAALVDWQLPTVCTAAAGSPYLLQRVSTPKQQVVLEGLVAKVAKVAMVAEAVVAMGLLQAVVAT